MADLRFVGRVVVVTGAGAGLGRVYALLFGSRGAKVVVNDLGGSRHGDGSSSKAADTVCEEIRRNGGTAVPDYNSVVEGEKIIKTALDNFGRIDIVVNNAGILRDKSFARISDQDWDLIQAVHVKGSFKTTQAAFPHFRKQGYGRIIMTSSNSGIYGNFGQANYSAAKLGLIGLANTIAIEGAKYNIHCNVIVPTAASRLTEDIFPPEIYDEFKPELIAPIIAYLCHESCKENGAVIESAAGWAGRVQIYRGKGALLRRKLTDGVTLENVRDNWDKVLDMSKAKFHESMQGATGGLMTTINDLKNGAVQEDLVEFDFTERDTILYALGVGTSITKSHERKFLYENDSDFDVLPTFYVLPSLDAMYRGNVTDFSTLIPGKEISMANILHGEQYIEFLGEVPKEGVLYSKPVVVEVLDKGSGAALVYNVDSFNDKGELVLRNQIVSFAVGAGNFGGPKTGKAAVPCIPKPTRKPDVVLSQKTTLDQAALYRLSGDRNPLHIDPDMSQLGGFKQPILHGLCSFGFSVRLILAAYADGDASLVKAVKVRFIKPVTPGDTLKVNMWREGNRILFETVVAETNTPVIGGAYVDLRSVKIMQPQSNNVSASSLDSDAIFQFVIEQVKADPNKAKALGGVFLYKITKNGKEVKQWTMDLKNATVYEGPPQNAKPNTTLTISDEDFVAMSEGKLQPQAAFMKGKLKVAGNIMMAQKLAPLLKASAKL